MSQPTSLPLHGRTRRINCYGQRKTALIGRRRFGEGRQAPSQVIAGEPLQIESLGAPREVEDSAGVIESVREVTVKLPTLAKLGVNTGSIAIQWPDGLSQSQRLAWVVEPKIQLAPPTILLKSSATGATVRLVVRSEGSPFRILDVVGSLLMGKVAVPEQAAPIHTLQVVLDPKRLTTGVSPEIEVVTDDPDQPRVQLGVLVIPQVAGEVP